MLTVESADPGPADGPVPFDGTGASAGVTPASDRLVEDFLADRPAAIEMISGWARSIAAYRAWGFESPDDIVQSTLLALVRNLRAGRFQGGELRHYVQRIAKNLCISAYRRVRRRGSELPLREEGNGSEESGPGAELVAGGLDAETRAMLAEILEGLDEDCRNIIDLAYLVGLSRTEIATQLGISAGAARVRLYRCLEKARQAAMSEESDS